jgi:alkylhydroperoxidase family enzyme
VSQVSQIEWDSALTAPRSDPDFAERFLRATGRPPVAYRYMTGVPWLLDALTELSVELERRVALDADLADLVGLVVSQDNSCRYCFATIRFFMLVLGTPSDKLERLEQDLLTVDFDAAERAALDFARRVSRSDPLPTPAHLQRLRDHGYSELEIAELIGAIGVHIFFNRLSTLIALPPATPEALPGKWYVRALRPLVAFRLRNVRRRSAEVALRPGEADGPYESIIRGLDGLPLAGVLRRSVDGMFASELLSRRCKALVLAVVSRALGCPHGEAEARALLEAEGLDAGTVDGILAHLSSPVLDEIERVVVPFARETVWYEPIEIQRRGREVMRVLSREQFLELVAVASLANALCRSYIVTRAVA